MLQKGDDGLRDELGFTVGTSSSKLDLSASLEDVSANLSSGLDPYNSEGNVEFTINGVTIKASSSDSLSSVINKINSSAAGVTMRYDSLTDRFVIESKETGLAAKVDIKDVEGNFLSH
ncbi:hypothetical protein N752_05335 [Desulforamulus aquiferis]|nr:flagellin hook IN motif-containing protein [Desulforamulus aquiferis]RYD06317.1 hypothetical protein N752_05335 [Desulforamulus aquiferis]